MRVLPLLALLSLPVAAADDLGWTVGVVSCSKYAPVEFSALLRNVTAAKVPFKPDGDRPAIELVLTPEGKSAVRKPLPKEAICTKGPAEIEPGAFAWHVAGDLRRAFGRLPPGRYTLRAGDSEAAAFEVIDTSVEEARKNWKAPEGIELRVADGALVLVNRRKTPIVVPSYGDRDPLDTLATPQQWNGRAWTRFVGGFCGTGLVDVTIPAGGQRSLALPPLPDGILQVSVSCSERKGDAAEWFEAVTEPFLVDTFGG
jgi:hypothetical protein